MMFDEDTIYLCLFERKSTQVSAHRFKYVIALSEKFAWEKLTRACKYQTLAEAHEKWILCDMYRENNECHELFPESGIIN